MRRRDALLHLGTLVGAAGRALAPGPGDRSRPRLDRFAVPIGPRPQSDYTVYLSPARRTLILDVHRPMPLVPGVPKGRRFLKKALRVEPGKPPQPIALVDGVVPAQPGATTRLVMDAVGISRETAGGRADRSSTLFLWPALWLWRPRLLRDGPRTLFFDVQGAQISTAWTQQADGTYLLPDSTFRYKSRVLIGDFEAWTVRFARGAARVAHLGPTGQRPAVTPWVADALRGVAALHPHFPPAPQIVVFDEGGADVGFGTALRGGGGGVSVWLGRRATYADIRTDWTLTHELLHLGMPHLRSADAWLSEGVTQYHTYVAQARAGVITPEAAWRAIHAGFGRGRSAERGASLRRESDTLSSRYNYWFVYWAGAAFALRLDVWLRTHGRDLPALLAHWYRSEGGCCDGERTAAHLLSIADRWAGSSWPGETARAALRARAMPDLRATYARIGLTADGGLSQGDSVARRIMTG